jgi:hypothetical protein
MAEHTHSVTRDSRHSSVEAAMKSMSINRLLLMAAIHFVLMYSLMYAMVNTFSDIFPNLNQVYMAGIMTAPMLILEIILQMKATLERLE